MGLAARQAVTCWFAALFLVIVALFVFLGAPASHAGAGEAIGRALAHAGFAAFVGWYFARRARPAWSWGRFVLVYIALVVVIAVVAAAGRVHAREPSAIISANHSQPTAGRVAASAQRADTVLVRKSEATTMASYSPHFMLPLAPIPKVPRLDKETAELQKVTTSWMRGMSTVRTTSLCMCRTQIRRTENAPRNQVFRPAATSWSMGSPMGGGGLCHSHATYKLDLRLYCA